MKIDDDLMTILLDNLFAVFLRTAAFLALGSLFPKFGGITRLRFFITSLNYAPNITKSEIFMKTKDAHKTCKIQ